MPITTTSTSSATTTNRTSIIVTTTVITGNNRLTTTANIRKFSFSNYIFDLDENEIDRRKEAEFVFSSPPTFENVTTSSTSNTFTTDDNYDDVNMMAPDTNWPALLLILFIVSGVFGNTLVCIAVSTERRLQNVTNYFLLSLSVADLLVCTFVMPFSILTVLNYGKWELGFTLCAVHCYTDVFLCSASIVHMTAISVDRYLGISSPLKLRNKSNFIVLCKIVVVWVLTVIISCPLAVLFMLNPSDIYTKENQNSDNDFEDGATSVASVCQINNRYYMIYGSTLAFLIPFVIMLITYVRTTQLLKQQALLLGSVVSGGGTDRNNSAKRIVGNEGLRRSRTKRSNSSRRNKQQQFHKHQAKSVDLVDPEPSSVNSEQGVRPTSAGPPVFLRHSSSAEQVLDNSSSGANNKRHNNWKKWSTGGRGAESRPFLRDKSTENGDKKFKNIADFRSHFKLLTTPPSRRRFFAKEEHKDSTVNSSSAAEVASEQKATRVLGLVFACFFVCWTPFFALNFVYAFCGATATNCQAPFFVETIFLWLGFVSSVINPIIYTVFNKKFRQAFSRIVRCRWRQRFAYSKSYSNSFSFTNTNTNLQQRTMSRTNSQHQSSAAPRQNSCQKISTSSAVIFANNYSNPNQINKKMSFDNNHRSLTFD